MDTEKRNGGTVMARPKTKTASQSTAEWHKKNYDAIIVSVQRGAKEQLKALAQDAGVSLNRYILEAVEARSGLKLTLDNALPWMEKQQ